MRNNDNSPKVRAFSKERPARNGGNKRNNSSNRRVLHTEGEGKDDETWSQRRESDGRKSGSDYGNKRRSPRSKSGDVDRKRSYNRRDGEERSERRSYNRRDGEERGEKRSYNRRDGEERGEKRSYNRRDGEERGERRSYNRRDGEERGERRSYNRRDGEERGERRSYNRRDGEERGERRSYNRRDGEERGERRSYNRRDGEERGERRSFSKSSENRGRGNNNSGRSFTKGNANEKTTKRRPRRDVTAESEILTEIVDRRRREGRPSLQKVKVRSLEYEEQYGPIRLNKYISNAGVCSRREADTLIVAGAITVNGNVVTELGFKVNPTDEVRFGDRILQREKPVYVLLNKPKDYITTMYDEFDRKDVMELVKGACKERIYPVGRLDRDTTGLLLFTNDGEMTKKLTHPKHNIRKIYHVSLDKNLKVPDFESIANGLEFDDDVIVPDELAYIGDSKREIGITIHSGKNRIVRRIFESLGYQVEKLDRVVFAGLTKKDLPRGTWRFLTQAEINFLKMSN